MWRKSRASEWRELGDRAGHLHPGRSTADDDGGEEPCPLLRIVAHLGPLESQEQARPDGAGIPKRPRSGSRRGPVVVAEIVVRGAGGDHQPVERNPRALRKNNTLGARVDAGHFVEDHLDVLVARKHVPDGPCDVSGRQRRGRHLVEQRHEQVVVVTIDHRNTGRRAPEATRTRETAKAGANDHHVGFVRFDQRPCLFVVKRLGGLSVPGALKAGGKAVSR